MEFRLARPGDLPQLKAVYQKIIAHMEENGIFMWDTCYPCCCFEEDVESKRLYMLTQQEEIVAAFVLSAENEMEACAQWSRPHAKALYVERLGVNAAYARQGIGSKMLEKAMVLAKEQGAEDLRLFVVDDNEPAIRLYRESGFHQLAGTLEQVIDDTLTLHEFAFQKQIAP